MGIYVSISSSIAIVGRDMKRRFILLIHNPLVIGKNLSLKHLTQLFLERDSISIFFRFFCRVATAQIQVVEDGSEQCRWWQGSRTMSKKSRGGAANAFDDHCFARLLVIFGTF
jgi:hypothetical protein